jgi:hypothetical protein
MPLTLEELTTRLEKVEVENRKLKKARAKAPRRARPAAAPEPKDRAEFEGLYADMCCEECTQARCVISGMNYCAHPRKGGLQSVGMNDPIAVSRLNRAKAYLKQQEGDDAARRVLGGGYAR